MVGWSDTIMIRIEVKKAGNETTSSLIRRFTKRVQGSGILRAARSRRYAERDKSEYVTRKFALKRIERTKKYEELKKLGKIKETRY